MHFFETQCFQEVLKHLEEAFVNNGYSRIENRRGTRLKRRTRQKQIMSKRENVLTIFNTTLKRFPNGVGHQENVLEV